MGGSSTPQNANAGNALANLFLSNQATPQVSTPPVAAPQSLITGVPFMPVRVPVNYVVPQPATPSAPRGPNPADYYSGSGRDNR